MIRKVLVAVAMMSASWTYGQQLAFPGAEGFGKYATGGRGGRVVEVTNLLDIDRFGNSVEGSFRAAVNTSGDDPITIVFKVSGVIELGGELKSSRSNMTIAGQTAPGDGICFKDNSIKLSGENLIVRYLRFRPGNDKGGQTSALNIENAGNLIVDHCSMSWSVEENMGFYDNDSSTVQWCILSEGLYDAGHSKGPRGYGSQWGGQYSSFHHNLFAHNFSRSPRLNGSVSNDIYALGDYRNNVIFNWGKTNSVYGGEVRREGGGQCLVNWVNNYYAHGPASETFSMFAGPSQGEFGDSEWYVSGNFMEGNPRGINDDNWEGISESEIGSIDKIRVASEHSVSPVETQSAQVAYELILENAGATLPKRDAVDARIMNEVEGNVEVTGDGIIDNPSEVGGWPEYESLPALTDTDVDGMPDDYETENGLDPNDAEDGKIITESGYSNLEVYLNSIDGVTGVIPPTSIASDVSVDFEVYPNPSSDHFFIRSTAQIVRLQLFNLQGQAVLSLDENQVRGAVSLDSVKEGIYLLRASFRDGSSIERKIRKI